MSLLFWLLGGSPMTVAASPLTTLFLVVCVVLTGYIAVRVRRRSRPADLNELHRQVDILRRQMREAADRGDSVEALRQALSRLSVLLPQDDLRRR